ncbi:MAG: hypothetical protein ACE5MK_06305 [Acidobacteriota bacterium]
MMIEEEIERLSQTYAGKVLSRRTRVVSLLGRKCEPLILYTFLGFELKMARKRITCPDMSTARYLKIFAELGMPSIRIPYDPTQTGRLLVELELPLQRIKELLLAEKLKQKQHQLKHRRIYKKIRDRLKRAEADHLINAAAK